MAVQGLAVEADVDELGNTARELLAKLSLAYPDMDTKRVDPSLDKGGAHSYHSPGSR